MACHTEVLNDGGYVAAESAAPLLLGMMCPSGERVWSSCVYYLERAGQPLQRGASFGSYRQTKESASETLQAST